MVEEDRVTIRDLGSRNGTIVNGEKIEAKQTLKNGDQLTVGRFEFKIRITDDAKVTDNAKATDDALVTDAPSTKSVEDTQAMADPSEHTASISGIALSIMEELVEASDDEYELTGKSAQAQTLAGLKDDESTQTLTLPKGQAASTESESSEEDEDSESEDSEDKDDPSKYVISEAEKEAARNNRAIVGVSKTAQQKRVTATSHEAAAEALRRFNR